jgi:hypothetical protein
MRDKRSMCFWATAEPHTSTPLTPLQTTPSILPTTTPASYHHPPPKNLTTPRQRSKLPTPGNSPPFFLTAGTSEIWIYGRRVCRTRRPPQTSPIFFEVGKCRNLGLQGGVSCVKRGYT